MRSFLRASWTGLEHRGHGLGLGSRSQLHLASRVGDSVGTHGLDLDHMPRGWTGIVIVLKGRRIQAGLNIAAFGPGRLRSRRYQGEPDLEGQVS